MYSVNWYIFYISAFNKTKAIKV